MLFFQKKQFANFCGGTYQLSYRQSIYYVNFSQFYKSITFKKKLSSMTCMKMPKDVENIVFGRTCLRCLVHFSLYYVHSTTTICPLLHSTSSLIVFYNMWMFISLFFIFSNFYWLYLRNKTRNIWWGTSKDWIENWTFPNLVVHVCWFLD